MMFRMAQQIRDMSAVDWNTEPICAHISAALKIYGRTF